MTNEEQSKRFYELLNTIKNLHDSKKHDYGAKEDIFANSGRGDVIIEIYLE